MKEKDFEPLHNIGGFLNALHVCVDEARKGQTRVVEVHHFCSHVREIGMLGKLIAVMRSRSVILL